MEPRRKKTSVLDEGHPTLPQGVGGRTVLVYEDKPSTVVAYALSSKLYWLKLVDAMVAVSRHSASMQGLSTFTSDTVFGDPMHLSPSRPTVRSRSSGGTAAGDATATDMLRPTQLPHPVAPSVRTLWLCREANALSRVCGVARTHSRGWNMQEAAGGEAAGSLSPRSNGSVRDGRSLSASRAPVSSTSPHGESMSPMVRRDLTLARTRSQV